MTTGALILFAVAGIILASVFVDGVLKG